MDNGDSMSVDTGTQSGIVRSLRDRIKKPPLPKLGAGLITGVADDGKPRKKWKTCRRITPKHRSCSMRAPHHPNCGESAGTHGAACSIRMSQPGSSCWRPPSPSRGRFRKRKIKHASRLALAGEPRQPGYPVMVRRTPRPSAGSVRFRHSGGRSTSSRSTRGAGYRAPS